MNDLAGELTKVRNEHWESWREAPRAITAFWNQRNLPEPAKTYLTNPHLIDAVIAEDWRIPEGMLTETAEAGTFEEIWDEDTLTRMILTNNERLIDRAENLANGLFERIEAEIRLGMEIPVNEKYDGLLPVDPRTLRMNRADMMTLRTDSRLLESYEEATVISQNMWEQQLLDMALLSLNGTHPQSMTQMQVWELEVLTGTMLGHSYMERKYRPSQTQLSQLTIEIAARTGTQTI